jgi:hypothetical protein
LRHTTVQDRPFEERLLETLLEAHQEWWGIPERPREALRRKASRRGLGIGALLAATLVVGGWVVSSSVIGDTTIEVDAAAAAEDPQVVERELREAGIDAEVRAVPVGDPFFRGKWLWLHFPPDVDIDPDTFALLQSYVRMIDMSAPSVEERCPRGVGCERTAILELPRGIPGPIVLIAGRAPRAGEEGWQNVDPMNELAPTGALYCFRLEERRAAQAGRRLEELGYRVIWRYSPVDVVSFMEPIEYLDRPPPGTGIVYAWFGGPKVVDVGLVRATHVAEQRRLAGTPVTPEDRPKLTWAPDC